MIPENYKTEDAARRTWCSQTRYIPKSGIHDGGVNRHISRTEDASLNPPEARCIASECGHWLWDVAGTPDKKGMGHCGLINDTGPEIHTYALSGPKEGK